MKTLYQILILLFAVMFTSCGSNSTTLTTNQNSTGAEQVTKTTQDRKNIYQGTDVVLGTDNMPTVSTAKRPTAQDSKSPSGNILTGEMQLQEFTKKEPYKQLFDTKQWKLIAAPAKNAWEFSLPDSKIIKISFRGKPYPGWKNSVSINEMRITDISKCLEHGDTILPGMSEALCSKYYFAINIDGTEVKNEWGWMIDALWVSKNEPKIALYSGMILVNYETGKYEILESNSISLNDYILLSRVD